VSSTTPRFGPTEAPTFNRVPFEFSYLRDETLETQTFNLLAKPMDISAANIVLRQSNSADDSQVIPALLNLIAKYMDDKDGTGARWAPVELPAKPGEDPPVRRFRGPDGKLHAWSKAETFLAPERGSSRRRWVALMDDDDASVDENSLVKLLQFLVEVAGKGHTRA
jgi:hypothetical protein